MVVALPRAINGDFLVGEVWEKHSTPICLVLLVVGVIAHPNDHSQTTALPTQLYTAHATTNSSHFVVNLGDILERLICHCG